MSGARMVPWGLPIIRSKTELHDLLVFVFFLVSEVTIKSSLTSFDNSRGNPYAHFLVKII